MDEARMAIWQRSMLVALRSTMGTKMVLPNVLPNVLPMDELVDVLPNVLHSLDEAMVVVGK